jgi:hypothetical protein
MSLSSVERYFVSRVKKHKRIHTRASLPPCVHSTLTLLGTHSLTLLRPVRSTSEISVCGFGRDRARSSSNKTAQQRDFMVNSVRRSFGGITKQKLEQIKKAVVTRMRVHKIVCMHSHEQEFQRSSNLPLHYIQSSLKV